MIRKIVLAAAIAAAALALGACASQETATTPAAPHTVAKVAAPAPASQQKGQQMICTSGTSIGSHIAKTTCMTAAQYKAQQKQNAKSREALQKMEQQAQSPNVLGGGGGGR